MQTLVPAALCRHSRIRVATRRAMEFIDLTDQIVALAEDAGIQAGLVNIQSLHTTTSIVVNEHEPLLLADFATLLGDAVPQHAHCRALLLPSSAMLNVVEGRLQLGRWQRVFLVELDGPRAREVSVFIFGDGVR